MEIFKKNGLYGLKNEDGEVVITPQYIEFYSFSCGVACVRNVKYEFAYIDVNNHAVVPFGRYRWLDPYFTCGYARVIGYSISANKEYWGIINTLGSLIIPLEYDNIWTIKEQYIDNLKAYKGDKECRINLRNADRSIILDDLKYIKTYTIDEFKAEFNVNQVFVKLNLSDQIISFYYGTNLGVVANDNYMDDPVISIVCNSAGKIFGLLHNKNNTGKKRVVERIIKTQRNSIPSYSSNYNSHNEYEEYNCYIEESRLDAFEGDESNYWNID